ncbi:hypothetical protein M0R45_000276 [Rubus argutus]|uniref:peroxidase n=1 Tax=Rubus argutus TaxID=59490 RepID=A0AAW1VPT7_RUBAR
MDTFQAKGAFYEVPTGRMDGRVSNLDQAATMPDVDDPITLLKSKFLDKGLSEKDLVLLTAGAHTIGTTACFSMEKSLHNFSSSAKSDPSINPEFLPELKKKCPLGGDGNVRLPLDPATHDKFDVKPFQNLRRGFAVLAFDARLMEDPVTRGVVESYLKSGGQVSFNKDFIQSILKLRAIGVKSAGEGEIRKSCSKLN